MNLFPEVTNRLLGGEVGSVCLDEFHHSHPTLREFFGVESYQ